MKTKPVSKMKRPITNSGIIHVTVTLLDGKLV